MTETRFTTCNRDCPDACRIAAQVDGDRVISLTGAKDHPVTAGFLCYRTSHFLERQHGDLRLRHPLLRRDGELVEATWSEALDLVADELLRIRSAHGAEAIFQYRSGGSLGKLKKLWDLLFARFGPVTRKRGDICSGGPTAAQLADFGAVTQNSIDGLDDAESIWLWGKNVFTSSPHLIPRLRRARRRGARITLIDPVHHQTATLADRVLAPRPGADAFLAFGIARVLLDRGALPADAERWCAGLPGWRAVVESRSASDWASTADVDEGVIAELADEIATRRLTTLLGWGAGRRRNGAGIVRAIDALHAATGQIGEPGRGVSFGSSTGGAFTSLDVPAAPRTIAEPMFGPGVLAADPPIRAVVVACGNPAAMLPHSGAVRAAFDQAELSVVIDNWLSDTAALADVVLPTATLLEDDDLVGSYGHEYLGAATPVVARPETVRTDLEIIGALAERLGVEGFDRSAASWKRELISNDLRAAGVDLDDLERGPQKNPLVPDVAFVGRHFATEDGRAHLLQEAPALPAAAEPDDEHPLTLLSISTPEMQSSQFVVAKTGPAEVRVHPDAAGELPDGATARLCSRLGELQVVVRHDPKQRVDVALIPKGGGPASGRCANTLIDAQCTDHGEGAALYDTRVSLRPPRS